MESSFKSGNYESLQEVIINITKFLNTLEMAIEFCLKNF